MKRKKTVTARVSTIGDAVWLEFGQTQMDMNFSANGTVQRALRLKCDDHVRVMIEKV